MLRDLRESLADPDNGHPAEMVYLLSTEAAVRTRLDDSESASALLTEAVAVLDQHPEMPAVTLANVRMQLGLLEARRGLLRKSLAHLTQAAEEFELNPGSFAQSFFCRREIASVAGQLGYGKQAEETLQRLVKVSTVPGSPADLARIGALIELGNSYMDRHRWADAEPIYLRAREELIPAGSPAALACDLHQSLGGVYTHMNRFAEAEAEFTAALALAPQLYPASHTAVAQLHRNRAVFLLRSGRLAEARTDNETALRIYKECGGPALPDASETHFTQAMLLAIAAEWEESEYQLRLALAMKQEIYGEGHPATAMTLMKLGHMLYQQSAHTQARPMLTRAIRIMEDFRMDPALLSEGCIYLALLYDATGQKKEGKKARDKAQWYGWSAKQGRQK